MLPDNSFPFFDVRVERELGSSMGETCDLFFSSESLKVIESKFMLLLPLAKFTVFPGLAGWLS